MFSLIKQIFRVPTFQKQEQFPELTEFEIRQAAMIDEFVKCCKELSMLCSSAIVRDMAKPYSVTVYILEDYFKRSLNMDLFLQKTIESTAATEGQSNIHLRLRVLTSKLRRLGTAIASNGVGRYALVERLFEEAFYADPYVDAPRLSTFDNRLAVYDQNVYLTVTYSTFKDNDKCGLGKVNFLNFWKKNQVKKYWH